MEQYVFGGLRAENGLIPTLSEAKRLLRLFRPSSRGFEVIFCSTEPVPSLPRETVGWVDLGIDVAALGGDFWSIVRDLQKPMLSFRERLNGYGLFTSPRNAGAYLDQYRNGRMPDHATPFVLLHVYCDDEGAQSRQQRRSTCRGLATGQGPVSLGRSGQ